MPKSNLILNFFVFSSSAFFIYLIFFPFCTISSIFYWVILFIFLFLILGGICGGKCCDNRTETDVLSKSIKVFEGLIKHHTRSLKGLWDSTANIYKGVYMYKIWIESISYVFVKDYKVVFENAMKTHKIKAKKKKTFFTK